MAVSVSQDGKLVFIGTLRPEDRGVLVRRVRRSKVEDIKSILGVFSGAEGKATAFADGLIVVADSVEVLKRTNEMLDLVEDAEAPVWVVQLHLVSYTSEAADDLGINLEPAAKAGLAFALGSSTAGAGVAAAHGVSVSASLDAVLRMAHNKSGVSVVAAPMFVLCDGSKSSFVQGDKLPLPRRTVSNEGTVTISGYDYVQTGVQVDLALREWAEESAYVDTTIKLSDVKRMVEEAAVTGEETFSTTAVVKAGGVYLLGCLEQDRGSGAEQLGFQSGATRDDSCQVVQVWLQCYRIGGDVSGKRDLVPIRAVERSQDIVSVPAAAVGKAADDANGWGVAPRSGPLHRWSAWSLRPASGVLAPVRVPFEVDSGV